MNAPDDAVLRAWTVGDATALREAVHTTPDLQRQFGDTDLDSLEAVRAYIVHALGARATRRTWAIDIDGQAVGSVAVSSIDDRHDTAWVSYWLVPDARGRGLATRALAAVSQWAFAHGTHRLELGHRTENPESCRVATRAGFAVEGIERKKLRYGDDRFDVERHARLATDPAPGIPPLPFAHDETDAGNERVRAIAVGLLVQDGLVLAEEYAATAAHPTFLRAPGGGVEFGETADDAVRREFAEELGVVLDDARLLTVTQNIYDREGRRGHEIAFVFAVRCAELERLPLDARLPVADSHTSVGWYRLDRLADGIPPFYPDGALRIAAQLG